MLDTDIRMRYVLFKDLWRRSNLFLTTNISKNAKLAEK